MSTSAPKARIHCTPIPDGVRDGKRLQISLVLTPERPPELGEPRPTPGPDLDLGEWPSQLLKLADQDDPDPFMLVLGFFELDGSLKQPIAIPLSPSVFDNWTSNRSRQQRIAARAAELWQRIFRFKTTSNTFDYLLNVTSPKKPTDQDQVKSGSVTVDSMKVRFTNLYALSQTLVQGRAAEDGWRMLLVGLAALLRKAVKGEGPFAGRANVLQVGLVDALYQRPLRDPLLYYRLGTAECYVFADRRPDALGRIAAVRDRYDPSSVDGRAEGDFTSKNWINRVEKQFRDLQRVPDANPQTAITGTRFEGIGIDAYGVDADFRLQLSSGIGDLQRFFLSTLAAHELTVPMEKNQWRIDRYRALDAISEEDVRRKYAGIRSQPTLAKFLGLIWDIGIEASAIPNLADRGFMVAGLFRKSEVDNAGFLASALGTLDHIAYSWTDAHGSKRFVTASGRTWFDDNVKVDGHFHLNLADFKYGHKSDFGLIDIAKDNDVKTGAPRYAIQVGDPVLLMQSLQQQSGAIIEAVTNGAPADSVSGQFPDTQERGLQILDCGSPDDTMLKFTRATDAGKPANIYFAEDLCIGYRPDVRRTYYQKGKRSGATPEWRPLTARKISIDELQGVFGPGSHPYLDYESRDHGVVRTATKVVPQRNSSDKTPRAYAPSQAIVTWTGDHLGLPAYDEPNHGDAVPVDIDRDLNVSIEFDFSPKESHRPHVLRVADGYEFRLRLVMPNGGSVSFEEANGLTEPRFVLGNGPWPYRYLYSGNIRPPVVLLPKEDSLVTNDSKLGPNERDDRLVLRAGKYNRKTRVKRFIVPGRVGFDKAEAFGLLDRQVDQAYPRGALRRFKKHPVTGEFPVARSFEIVWDRSKEKIANRTSKPPHDKGQVTGAVLEPLPAPGPEQNGYFPEPMGRNLSFMVERRGAVPEGFDERAPTVTFWQSDESPLAAKPVLLEVRADATLGTGGVFSLEKEVLSNGARVSKLVLSVAPGEAFTLWYWAWPDAANLATDHFRAAHAVSAIGPLMKTAPAALREAVVAALNITSVDGAEVLEAVASLAPIGKRSDRVLQTSSDAPESVGAELAAFYETALSESPFSGLTGFGKIDVVHAVEQPIEVPKFLPSDPAGKVAFELVRLPHDQAWDDAYVAYQAPKRSDLSDLQSQRGGTVAYLTGSLQIDRRSTGQVVLEAAWLDCSDRTAIKGAPGSFVFSPEFRAFEIARMPGVELYESDDVQADISPIFNLAYDGKQTLRHLSYNFGDTAARRLYMRAKAISRFASDFDQPALDDGRFEVASRPAFKTTPVGKLDESEETVVWILSTERPPRPAVKRIAWVTPEQNIVSSPSHVVMEKACYPRLHLDGPWHVSGEDEYLAIIIVPEDSVDDVLEESGDAGSMLHLPLNPQMPLPSEQDRSDDLRRSDLSVFASGKKFAGMADYLTRWGADPMTEAGALEPLILPERFRGHVARMGEVELPLPGMEGTKPGQSTPTPPSVPLPKVSVLLYKPILDPEDGSWYVDIGIDPGASHMPFVHLSIARYQEHSLPGLSLSEPVTLDPIQIPAKRTVEIFVEEQKRVVAHVHGVGYTKRDPYGVNLALRDLTDSPLQNVQLLRQLPKGQGAIATYDKKGQALQAQWIRPIEDGPELRWICAFDLPASRTNETHSKATCYCLQFDEIDLHPRDVGLTASPAFGEDKTFVEKPAMFSCLVSLPALS